MCVTFRLVHEPPYTHCSMLHCKVIGDAGGPHGDLGSHMIKMAESFSAWVSE